MEPCNEDIQLESESIPSVAKSAHYQDAYDESSSETELLDNSVDEDDDRKQPSQLSQLDDDNDNTESHISASHGAGGKTKFDNGEGNSTSEDDSSDNNSNEDYVSSGVEDLDSERSALDLLDKTKK
jgi:hypothetical protein